VYEDFLAITVLVKVEGVDRFKRVAYFRAGSRESCGIVAAEYEQRGPDNPPRDWDWDKDLQPTRVTII
jgi:hypothetical protein